MTLNRHQAVGAYRLWEPRSFDEPAEAEMPPEAEAETPSEPEQGPATDLPPGFHLPTAEEIEAMHEEARKEGYAAGYEDGAARGRLEAARLHDLAGALEHSLARLDKDVAEELVALAVELARRMVGRTLAERPEAVVETVKAALAQLPHNNIRIHLHPDDVALVRDYLAEHQAHAGHRIVEDDEVTRGGCRLDTGGSGIDATVETRWRRILEGLGREHTDWGEGE